MSPRSFPNAVSHGRLLWDREGSFVRAVGHRSRFAAARAELEVGRVCNPLELFWTSVRGELVVLLGRVDASVFDPRPALRAWKRIEGREAEHVR